jgi:hypothetical protein
VTPPRPAPDGGWPATRLRGDIELFYDLGDLADTGAATALTLFHPAQNQAVLVMAAADLGAVEARLRPQLGASLCVVPSRWTQDQLESVRKYLDQHSRQWNRLQLGPQHGEDGQWSELRWSWTWRARYCWPARARVLQGRAVPAA